MYDFIEEGVPAGGTWFSRSVVSEHVLQGVTKGVYEGVKNDSDKCYITFNGPFGLPCW